MKFFSVRSVFFLLISGLVCVIPPELLASKENDEREVYLLSVQGDVRVSLGKNHRPDLNQTWEQAMAGEPIQQGYAVATGDGRAEVEFENGSIVYLAEDSLLLFRELSAPGDRIVSSLSLATGTATFFLQSTAGASYFIETPTDRLSVNDPESFFARVDVFLDATAITPEGNQGETLHRRSFQDLRIARGQTLFLRGGEVVQLTGRPEGNGAESATPDGPGMFPSWQLVLRGLHNFQLPSMAAQPNQITEMKSSIANSQPTGAGEWDAWVCGRQAHRYAVNAAAVKASGLSSPIPGLADLYEHGTFFNCEPYGTCWEAAEPTEAQGFAPQSSPSGPQSTAPMQSPSGGTFQPQTVQWEEWSQAWCSSPMLQTVTHVAHTPEELQKLLRRREAALKTSLLRPLYAMSCENGYWIPHRRHYARVVTPQIPRHCVGAKCKPIHAPRPLWVRAGNTIGFVPAHPKDVKGKPPVNLKEGILFPPSRPGERPERIALEPSQKVNVLNKTPREFRSESFNQALRVSPPEIHAHLVQEVARESSLSLSAHAAPPINYDYNRTTSLCLLPSLQERSPKRYPSVESIRTEKSAALLTAVTVLSPKRSAAAKPRGPIVEVHSVPAAAMEAIAPGTPGEDMVPAILLDHTLLPRVHTAAALHIHRVEAEGRPVQAPAVPVAALAHRVQAARAVAHAVNRKHFL